MGALIRYDELETAFRLRLGNPTEGTFGRVYYDGIRDELDEIRFMLNEAQKYVTWLCYSANQTLIEDTLYLQVLSGATRYTLNDLFLGPVAVFHHTHNQIYEVEKENLIDVKGRIRTERHNYRYYWYEIRERVPRIAARGIVQSDSLDTIDDDVDLRHVRVGDTVYNLTDHSEAEVKAAFPALNRVQVDQLMSGTTNRFQKGDVYQIDMREATCDAIEFYPAVNNPDSYTGYSGGPSYWLLQKDAIVQQIFANISEVPSNVEDDERFILQISQDDDDEVVGEAALEGLSKGSNCFQVPDLIQLREDVRYNVVVIRADGGSDIDVDTIQLEVKTDPERVEVRHARYPKPMEKSTDYCEMPEFALPACYVYAADLAFKKMSRSITSDPGIMNELEREIAKIKKFLFARDERGPHSVMPSLSGNRPSNWPYPGNWGHYGPDVFDLI